MIQPRNHKPHTTHTALQFASGLTAAHLQTLRGSALNAVYYVASRVLSRVLGFVAARGLVGIRRQHHIPLGSSSEGRSCAPMLQLCANSWHLEPPRPIGPPQVGAIGCVMIVVLVALLRYAVQCSAVLCCAALCSAALRCAVLRCAALCAPVKQGPKAQFIATSHSLLKNQTRPNHTTTNTTNTTHITPQVLIGPIAPRSPNPNLQPPAVDRFVNTAPSGVAVVSFGSAPVFGNFLSRADFVALSEAFADLKPLRVLWLLKRRNLPGSLTMEELPLGDNTMAAEWVVRDAPVFGG